MAEKLKSDLRLNRLRKQLAGTGGAPVADFQRFNVSGFDYKGQISSGFGEHGYGASAGISFNFGKLVLPGLFSLSVSAKITGEAGRRTMLVLQRDPSRARETPVKGVTKKSRAPWKNPKPLNLMLLRGKTKIGKVSVGAGVKLGIGSYTKVDEIGAAVGADVSAGACIEGSKVEDPAPRYYASAYESGLANDVEFLLNDRLKRAVALWVLDADAKSKIFNKAKKARQQILEADPNALNTAIKSSLTAIQDDDLDTELGKIPAFSADVKGLAKWLFKGKSAGIGRLGRPGTTTLLKSLGAHRTWREEKLASLAPERNRLLDPKIRPLVKKDQKQFDIIQASWEKSQQEIDDIDRMISMLRRRRDDKYFAKVAGPPLAPQTEKSFAAPSPAFLDIVTVKGEATAQAGLKFNATVPAVITAAAGASGSLKTAYCRIGCRYHSASVDAPFTGGAGRRMLMLQDTTVTYKHYFSADGKVEAAFSSLVTGTSKKKSKKGNLQYGTMTYESVNVTWFSTDPSNRRVILPNGSGVSVGVSVLGERVVAYAADCAAGNKPGKVGQKLETFLMSQLNVDEKTLRAFFADALVDWLPNDRSILIEAGYAFDALGRDAEKPLTFGRFHDPRNPNRPATDYEPSLFALGPVKKRLSQNKADKDAAKGNGSTHLQVLRLRMRQSDTEEKTRSVFSLGFAKKGIKLSDTDKEAGRGGKFGSPAVFRTFRAGSEGTFDFHVRYFGEREARFNEPANQTWAREFTIPPVALFNH